MRSPFQRHRDRTLASRVSEAAESADNDAKMRARTTAYERKLMLLVQDNRTLSGIQSIEGRAKVKREMLPNYDDWVEGVLAGSASTQDDIFMTMLVWHIDVGDFAGALPLARHAIRYGLKLPERYTRTTACLIAEEFADMALKADRANEAVDVDSLAAVTELTADQDMPDQVRAKLYKAMGRGRLKSNPAQALADLRRALELDKNAGVKKEIERLETQLK